MIVGAASAMANALHRAGPPGYVEVGRSWRRQGIGSALASALRDRPPEPTPILMKLWAGDEAGLAFAARHGFARVMRCRLPQVEPADPAVHDWLAAAEGTRHGYRISQATEATESELTEAFAALYAWTHESWNPVGSLATVRAGTRPDLHAETTKPDLPRGQDLVGALVARSLRLAAERGIPSLTVEADDSCVHLAAVFETLPAASSRVLYLLSDRSSAAGRPGPPAAR